MRCLLRIATAAGLLALALAAFAGNGTIQLSSFPAAALADGRSTLTITAEVRDETGSLAADGTQVVFDATLGNFRDRVVKTQAGHARAILVASSTPGTGKIRATALSLNAVSDLDIEFVANKSLLSATTEYIELVSKDSNLQYSVQDHILAASSPGQGVTLKFRGVEIQADDLQVRVQSYEVKARHAKLTIGKESRDFEDLFFRLNSKKGFGTGAIEVVRSEPVTNGLIAVPGKQVTKTVFTFMDISGVKVVEHQGTPDRRYFLFADLSQAISTVEARKAIAYPAKEIQFQRADVKVDGTSVMKVPLYEISASYSNPIVTDQYLSVSNNQVAINYPYYLSLAPGQTSLLRFRFGSRYGAGAGAANGTYLDYELNWGRLLGGEGGVALTGLARSDWGANLHHSWVFEDRSNINLQVDVPAHENIYSTISASKPFDGFNFNANANAGKSLTGTPLTSTGFSAVLEKDPIRIGHSPVNMYLGLTTSQTKVVGDGISDAQQTTGLTSRLVSSPIRLDSKSTFTGSYTVTEGFGSGDGAGISQQATLTVGTSLMPGWALTTSYDFQEDGYSSLLGRHRLSAETYFNRGKFNLSGSLSKTLDVDRLSGRTSIGYKLSPAWRLSYSYYLDRYAGDSFLDQVWILGFKIGFREVGLSYSARTQRLGFELLGTSFD